MALNRRQFTRFKYAEEYCQMLTLERINWQMTALYDQPYEDDGEIYTHDVFIVDWWEKE